MNAVVYQHEEHEGLGLSEAALKEAGFTISKRFREARHEDVNTDLVVVLGGPMGVYESKEHPFLGQELAVLSERLASEKPCLGICLGAQLLAAAAGAQVSLGKNGFEVGVGNVRWTAAALEDPVIAGVKAKMPVVHWHQDTYSSVPGAQLLASTDRYTQQAFRLGKSYGFQFHLELTAAELGRWFDQEAEQLQHQGKDVSALKAELPKLAAAEPSLKALWSRLAEHFAHAA
jgi:GMP synthase (glutamine-hydrolysing)